MPPRHAVVRLRALLVRPEPRNTPWDTPAWFRGVRRARGPSSRLGQPPPPPLGMEKWQIPHEIVLRSAMRLGSKPGPCGSMRNPNFAL